LLKWPVVEKRIAELIEQGKYLNAEDISSIPDYEKKEVARAVYAFFQDLPIEQPRPFPSGFDYYDAVNLVISQLESVEQVEELYQMMLPIWGTTPEDDRLYASRQGAFFAEWGKRGGTVNIIQEIWVNSTNMM